MNEISIFPTICEINLEVGILRQNFFYKAALIFFPRLLHTVKMLQFYHRRKTRLQILFRDMMNAAAQENEDQFVLKYQRWNTRPQILFRDMMKAAAQEDED